MVLWILIASFFLEPWVPAARAQSSPDGDSLTVWMVSQADMDGDGVLDVTTLACNCVTQLDEIRVYDSGGDMVESSDWRQAVDTDNDIWVIDIGSDGRPNLVIVFTTDSDSQSAFLFDDVDGDGQVAVCGVVSVSAPIISESSTCISGSATWTAKVTARPAWYDQDGTLVQNVVFQMSRPDVTSAQANRIPSLRGPEWELKDENRDGIAEFFSKAYPQGMPRNSARAQIFTNEIHRKSVPAEGAAFWPFLNFRPLPDTGFERLRSRFFNHPPELSIDWNLSKINRFVLEGYPIGAGLKIGQTGGQPMIRDAQRVNIPRGEIPMAWYDLAKNGDDYPELFIRVATEPAGYLVFGDPRLSLAQRFSWHSVRYSWNLFNPGSLIWDFKVDVMGRRAITNVVSFGDLNIQMVPYEDIPQWVTGNSWELTALMARETGNISSSEGLYQWSVFSGPQPLRDPTTALAYFRDALAYVTGTADIPPTEYFEPQTLPVGYRGEYDLSGPSKIELYVSTVDNRLHLKGAERGFLNLGAERYVIYENSDGSAYIDQWQLVERDQLLRQLNFTGSHAIYAGENGILIKAVDQRPFSVELPPPKDHVDWKHMTQLLSAPQNNINAADFETMVQELEGPEWRVPGATMRDFRPLNKSGGFRFVLNLESVAPHEIPDGPILHGLEPGEYMITYQGYFSTAALTPPSLGIAAETSLQENPRLSEPVQIKIEATNTGLQDAKDMELSVEARRDGEFVELERTRVDILSGEPMVTTVVWYPVKGGQWDIHVRLTDWHSKKTVAETVHEVILASSSESVMGFPTHLSEVVNLWPSILILSALSVLVGTLVRSRTMRGTDNQGANSKTENQSDVL